MSPAKPRSQWWKMDNVNIINIGYQAPEFILWDQWGQKHQARVLEGKTALVLVFYRGFWCPVTARYLTDLSKMQPEIAKLGAQLWGISAERMRDTQRCANQYEIQFPLLEDRDLVVSELYGVKNNSSPRPVAYPATFIFDSDLILRFKEVAVTQIKYPAPQLIVEELSRVVHG